MFSKHRASRAGSHGTSEYTATKESRDMEREPVPPSHHGEDGPIRLITFRVFAMGVIVSIGGFIFGYDTGKSKI
jgi:hypothetical protein